MKIIDLKLYEVDRLNRFYPKTMTINSESKLYYYPDRTKLRILKLIKNMNSNKVLTINLINRYKKDINIDELVLESDLVSVNGKPAGLINEYIEGKVLSKIIYNRDITIDYKIELLKKIGIVLEKMKNVRNKGINDFYIGDLHEDNIIITNDNDIRILDMDSSKIMHNKPFPSKFLTRYSKRMNQSHQITPNEYTDNYCFNMILLNALFSKDISKLKISDFYRHIDYLSRIGINSNLINNFGSMYNKVINTKNLYSEIDSLKDKKIYLK